MRRCTRNRKIHRPFEEPLVNQYANLVLIVRCDMLALSGFARAGEVVVFLSLAIDRLFAATGRRREPLMW